MNRVRAFAYLGVAGLFGAMLADGPIRTPSTAEAVRPTSAPQVAIAPAPTAVASIAKRSTPTAPAVGGRREARGGTRPAATTAATKYPTAEADDALIAAKDRAPAKQAATAETAAMETTTTEAATGVISTTAPVSETMVAGGPTATTVVTATEAPAIPPEELARQQAALREAQKRMGRAKVQFRLASIAQAEKELREADGKLKQAQSAQPKPQDLAKAEATVRAAEVNLQRIKDANAQAPDRAKLEAALRDAEARLKALGTPADPKAVAAARKTLAGAKAGYEQIAGAASLKKTTTEKKLGAATATLKAAQEGYSAARWQVQQAQAGIDPATGKSFADAQLNAEEQQQAYGAALAASEQQMHAAEAEIAALREALDVARKQEVEEVAAAQARVDAAGAELARVSQGPKPEDVARVRQEVEAARGALAKSKQDIRASGSAMGQAQAQLDQARAALDALKKGGNPAAIAEAQKVVDAAKAKLAKARQAGAGRGGWTWPTFGTISSGFGLRDMKVGRYHNGVDIANAKATPIGAARDGVVIEAGWCDGYGWCVKLRHSGGFSTEYGHLDGKPPVKAGDTVSAGTIIGSMGTSYDKEHGGYSTGVHLHFTLKHNGVAVDPMAYLP